MTPSKEISATDADKLAFSPGKALVGEEEIKLAELVEVILSGIWLVLGVFLLVVAAGASYAFLSAPSYEATGIVQVEKEKGLNASVDQISGLLTGRPAEAEAEVAIIKSRMVLSQVVDTLRLNIRAYPRYFPLIGGAITRLHKDPNTLASAWPGLGRFAWGGERIQITALDVPGRLQNKKLTLIYDGPGFRLLDPEGQLIISGVAGERAESDTGGQKIAIFVQSLTARPGTQFVVSKIAPQSAYVSLLNMIKVEEQPRDSGILQFKVTSNNPILAAQILNEIEDSYLRQNVERRSADAAQSLKFLQDQLPAMRTKVDEAQAALNAYQLANGAVDVQDETQLKLQEAVDLETSRMQLEQQRDSALQRLTPQHPLITSLDSQLKSIEKQEEQLKAKVSVLPTKQQDVLRLMRDLDVSTQLYTSVVNSTQQYQLAKAGSVGNARIVDAALPPLLPSAPKKGVIIALSVISGLILGISSVFFSRTMIKGVDRPEDIERAMGLACYASIPYSTFQRRLTRGFQRQDQGTSNLLAVQASDDLAIEAIRSLRTSLHFAMLEARNNVIMITGPTANLGKSFVSANLAAVLALGSKRVAIIDGDMRRGRLSHYFSLENSPGLSDFVAGTAAITDVLRSTVVQGLDFIAAGTRPPNPAEIILNPKFSELIESLKSKYDYVLIDTPPVLPVTDAATIGQIAGTSLLLLKAAEHPMRAIEETLRRLRQAGVRVSGCIFNQVGARIGSYGYGSYGYAYGYKAEGYGVEGD